jgi:hypothetical protein
MAEEAPWTLWDCVTKVGIPCFSTVAAAAALGLSIWSSRKRKAFEIELRAQQQAFEEEILRKLRQLQRKVANEQIDRIEKEEGTLSVSLSKEYCTDEEGNERLYRFVLLVTREGTLPLTVSEIHLECSNDRGVRVLHLAHNFFSGANASQAIFDQDGQQRTFLIGIERVLNMPGGMPTRVSAMIEDSLGERYLSNEVDCAGEQPYEPQSPQVWSR